MSAGGESLLQCGCSKKSLQKSKWRVWAHSGCCKPLCCPQDSCQLFLQKGKNGPPLPCKECFQQLVCPFCLWVSKQVFFWNDGWMSMSKLLSLNLPTFSVLFPAWWQSGWYSHGRLTFTHRCNQSCLWPRSCTWTDFSFSVWWWPIACHIQDAGLHLQCQLYLKTNSHGSFHQW